VNRRTAIAHLAIAVTAIACTRRVPQPSRGITEPKMYANLFYSVADDGLPRSAWMVVQLAVPPGEWEGEVWVDRCSLAQSRKPDATFATIDSVAAVTIPLALGEMVRVRSVIRRKDGGVPLWSSHQSITAPRAMLVDAGTICAWSPNT
jgi:hypothetical protein